MNVLKLKMEIAMEALCDAPRPELQLPSRVSGFRRVFCLVLCIHLWFFCIASCHHATHFKTQLIKLHGSLVHLNQGNSHGHSLYNIASQYWEAISNIHYKKKDTSVTFWAEQIFFLSYI